MRNGSFIVDLRASINEALGNAETIVKDASQILLSKIVEKTPVDTGRLQKNWNLSLNSVNMTTYDVSVEDPVSRAKKELDKFDLKTKQIWISNNLDYAYDIEFKGKSRVKAPQGMMRVSLIEFDQIFKGSAMKVNMGAGSKQNRYL